VAAVANSALRARLSAALLALAFAVPRADARGDDPPAGGEATATRPVGGPVGEISPKDLEVGVGVGVAASTGFRIQAVTTRVSAFDQYGHGYQSQAGPTLGAGSERATILEPQTEILATQGERLTHRIWLPVDVVTAASPDAIDRTPASADVVSAASRKVISGSVDWTATYKADKSTEVAMRNAVHLEEPVRSWTSALAWRRSLADENTVVAGNLIHTFDWFDRFDITGHRHGHDNRSSTTGALGVTQVLTPTTVVNLNYGLTTQLGQLGNTWNSVPLASGIRGPELLPKDRVRHALVGRAAQFLPWNGALRMYYRFYADGWGIVAHSAEAQLLQRLSPLLHVGVLYRFHTQTGAQFFTTLARDDAPLRVADSDLAPLDSHTVGAKVVLDVPLVGVAGYGEVRALHFEVGYERYVRTNDLRMNILTWSTGFRF
jgi:hypothetical protein